MGVVRRSKGEKAARKMRARTATPLGPHLQVFKVEIVHGKQGLRGRGQAVLLREPALHGDVGARAAAGLITLPHKVVVAAVAAKFCEMKRGGG